MPESIAAPLFFAAYSQPAAIKQKTKCPNCLQLDSVKPTVLIEKKNAVGMLRVRMNNGQNKNEKKKNTKRYAEFAGPQVIQIGRQREHNK